MRRKLLGLTAVLLASSMSLPVAAARSDDADVELAMEEARRALESAQGELAEIEVVIGGPGRGMFVTESRGRRAMIGITLVSEDDEHHSDEGVVVSAVSPGGPAAEAGIRADDLIIEIDDTPLDGRGDVSPERALVDYLSGIEPGEEVELTYLRDGDRDSVTVTTEAMGPQVFSFSGPGQQRFRFDGDGPMRLRMDPETGQFISRRGSWIDMELVNLSEGADNYFGTDSGILVVRAPQDEGFELQDWDVITEIGGREPRDPAHAMRILRSYMPGEELEITIYRDKRRQTLEIEVPELRRRYEELLMPE